MKIALLTDGIYPYVMGGMQKHSYYMARYLARSGVQVDLYHTSADPEAKLDELEGFTVQEKQHVRSFAIPYPEGDGLPGHYLREMLAYSKAILGRLRQEPETDFIYGQGYTGWQLLKEKQQGAAFPPVGINFHGLEMYQRPANLKARAEQLLLRPPTVFNLRRADVVFSLGGRLNDILLRLDIPEERIVTIPNGIESDWLTEEMRVSEGKRRLVFIGRYERRKGVEELSAVLPELLEHLPMTFDFIGPIPKEKRLSLPGITYHGSIREHERIQEILRKSDVLVVPSYSEGMPTVILEAMASSMAVLATDVGAVGALVSDATGWLIGPGDKKILRNTIRKAVQCPADGLLEKKRNARRFIEQNVLWDQVCRQLIEAIRYFSR